MISSSTSIVSCSGWTGRIFDRDAAYGVAGALQPVTRRVSHKPGFLKKPGLFALFVHRQVERVDAVVPAQQKHRVQVDDGHSQPTHVDIEAVLLMHLPDDGQVELAPVGLHVKHVAHGQPQRRRATRARPRSPGGDPATRPLQAAPG
ncbi:MAG: hypothetical protein V9G19_11085 [Tetrasphaera sp.]